MLEYTADATTHQQVHRGTSLLFAGDKTMAESEQQVESAKSLVSLLRAQFTIRSRGSVTISLEYQQPTGQSYWPRQSATHNCAACKKLFGSMCTSLFDVLSNFTLEGSCRPNCLRCHLMKQLRSIPKVKLQTKSQQQQEA